MSTATGFGGALLNKPSPLRLATMSLKIDKFRIQLSHYPCDLGQTYFPFVSWGLLQPQPKENHSLQGGHDVEVGDGGV